MHLTPFCVLCVAGPPDPAAIAKIENSFLTEFSLELQRQLFTFFERKLLSCW